MSLTAITTRFAQRALVRDAPARCYSKTVGVGATDWVKARDRAAEAAYVHEQDLESLRKISKKLRDVHAKQHGYDSAVEEIKHLRYVVPETRSMSDDALQRLLDWKHDVDGGVAGQRGKGSTMGV